MRAKISKWGNSLGIRLPKALTEETGLREGQIVNLSPTGGGFEVRSGPAIPRYTLEELVAEMERLGPDSRPPLVDFGPDVGAEIIDDDYSRGRIPAPSGGHRVARSAAYARKGTVGNKTRRRSD